MEIGESLKKTIKESGLVFRIRPDFVTNSDNKDVIKYVNSSLRLVRNIFTIKLSIVVKIQ